MNFRYLWTLKLFSYNFVIDSWRFVTSSRVMVLLSTVYVVV